MHLVLSLTPVSIPEVLVFYNFTPRQSVWYLTASHALGQSKASAPAGPEAESSLPGPGRVPPGKWAPR